LAAGTDLPAPQLEAFVLNRDHEPNARHLAFDLYGKVSPEAAAALVPGMIDDPSPSLRREAVAQLLGQGRKTLNEGDKDESAALLGRALDAARDIDQINAIAKLLREDLEQEVDLPEHFGFLMHWH